LAVEQGLLQVFFVPQANGQRHFCLFCDLSYPFGFILSFAGQIGNRFGGYLNIAFRTLFPT